MKERTLALAKSPHAERALFGIAFAEASFFPLPPDLLLGPMAAANPERWARYALTCTIGSVLGALLGYAIGLFVMDTVGNAILSFFGYGPAQRLELQDFYDKWGLLAIFIKGLTPIPFKLVTILSGALHYSLPMFVVACIATRGARFFLVAWLFQRFGPQIAPVLEKRLGLVLVGVAVLLVVAIVALRFMH
ncbi:MAG TPA: YqaA family protein [Caulobacterales bacterium]|nr:YqaA family protein [Caulobacterales bacterium]